MEYHTEDFKVEKIDIDIDQDTYKWEWDSYNDVESDGYFYYSSSGTDVKAPGKIKITITYLPTNQTWTDVWSGKFCGSVNGYEEDNTPGEESADWDSVEWEELVDGSLEYTDSPEGDWPKVFEDFDGNEDFEEAWNVLEDVVWEAINDELPFTE